MHQATASLRSNFQDFRYRLEATQGIRSSITKIPRMLCNWVLLAFSVLRDVVTWREDETCSWQIEFQKFVTWEDLDRNGERPGEASIGCVEARDEKGLQLECHWAALFVALEFGDFGSTVCHRLASCGYVLPPSSRRTPRLVS